jgi:hypothetical protein
VVRLLHSFGTEPFQPCYFGVEVVSVYVQMDPRRARIQALHEQPEVVAGQGRTVIFAERVLGEFQAGSTLPERQLAVVIRGRDVDNDLQERAVVRHVRSA